MWAQRVKYLGYAAVASGVAIMWWPRGVTVCGVAPNANASQLYEMLIGSGIVGIGLSYVAQKFPQFAPVIGWIRGLIPTRLPSEIDRSPVLPYSPPGPVKPQPNIIADVESIRQRIEQARTDEAKKLLATVARLEVAAWVDKEFPQEGVK